MAGESMVDRYQSCRDWQATHRAAVAAFEKVSELIESGGEPSPEQIDEALELRLTARQKLRRMVEDVQSWTPVARDPL